MTTEIINDLIPIPCTDREKLLKLRSLLIEIQSTWFDNLFDSGLTFADPIVWEKMQKAVCLMERRDNASQKGFDLKTIASDYKKLEKIFIASEWSADQFLLNSDDFKACDLVRVHHFSAIGILKEVQAFIANRQSEQSQPIDRLQEQSNKIHAMDFLSLEEKNSLLVELYEEPPKGSRKEVFHTYTKTGAIDGARVLNVPIPYWHGTSDRSIEERVVDSYPDEDTAYDIISKGV